MYKVHKRNGKIEDFDKSKIIKSIVSAGGSNEDAIKVAEEIEAWIPTVALNGIVKSVDIRQKALDIFKIINTGAADIYERFKKETSIPEP